jgi:methylated-DNA-[protein]-cysteine S-methyltransferase
METELIYSDNYDAPFGKLYLLAVDYALVALTFSKNELKSFEGKYFKNYKKIMGNKILEKTKIELDGYFNKKIKIFDIPLLLFGTEFQKRVWFQLLKIPYGKTISYKELASLSGSKDGFRAVGNANGRNNIAIIVPCHRVINHNKGLGGYGGGLDKKKFLLKLEGVDL